MRYDRARIKNAAKEVIHKTRPRPWTVTFIYWFLVLDFSALAFLIMLALGVFSLGEGESLSPFSLTLLIPVIIGLVLFLLLLHAGYRAYTARLCRAGKAGPIDLITGFLTATQVLSLDLLLLGLTALWALPGLGLVQLLLHFIFLLDAPVLSVALQVCVWILFGIYLINRLLTYSLSPNALLEHPQRPAWDAIQKSRRLMLGRKTDYLFLRLSFLGWAVLGAAIITLTTLPGVLIQSTAESLPLLAEAALPDWFFVPFLLVGIAAAAPLLLWLQAYQGLTVAGFYETACAPPFPGVTPSQTNQGGKRLIR